MHRLYQPSGPSFGYQISFRLLTIGLAPRSILLRSPLRFVILQRVATRGVKDVSVSTLSVSLSSSKHSCGLSSVQGEQNGGFPSYVAPNCQY